MQNRVRWMLWFTVLGSLALTTLGVCVGSVGLRTYCSRCWWQQRP